MSSPSFFPAPEFPAEAELLPAPLLPPGALPPEAACRKLLTLLCLLIPPAPIDPAGLPMPELILLPLPDAVPVEEEEVPVPMCDARPMPAEALSGGTRRAPAPGADEEPEEEEAPCRPREDSGRVGGISCVGE